MKPDLKKSKHGRRWTAAHLILLVCLVPILSSCVLTYFPPSPPWIRREEPIIDKIEKREGEAILSSYSFSQNNKDGNEFYSFYSEFDEKKWIKRPNPRLDLLKIHKVKVKYSDKSENFRNYIGLKANSKSIGESVKDSSFLGLNYTGYEGKFAIEVDYVPKIEGEQVGIALYFDNGHYAFCGLSYKDGKPIALMQARLLDSDPFEGTLIETADLSKINKGVYNFSMSIDHESVYCRHDNNDSPRDGLINFYNVIKIQSLKIDADTVANERYLGFYAYRPGV